MNMNYCYYIEYLLLGRGTDPEIVRNVTTNLRIVVNSLNFADTDEIKIINNNVSLGSDDFIEFDLETLCFNIENKQIKMFVMLTKEGIFSYGNVKKFLDESFHIIEFSYADEEGLGKFYNKGKVAYLKAKEDTISVFNFESENIFPDYEYSYNVEKNKVSSLANCYKFYKNIMPIQRERIKEK